MKFFDIFIHYFNCFVTVWMNVSEDGDAGVASSKNEPEERKTQGGSRGGRSVLCFFQQRFCKLLMLCCNPASGPLYLSLNFGSIFNHPSVVA